MNTLRKDGYFIFFIGCAVIGFGIYFCIYTFSNRRSSRVGAPPEQRGFVLDVAGPADSAFQSDLAEMRNVHATAVLFVADPANASLPGIVSEAANQNLVPWLAIPPSDKPEAYRATAKAAAKFCADHNVAYLVLGLRLTTSLGEESYWHSLIDSIRKSTPDIQVIFVTEHEEYMWCTWWHDSDILGVTGKFPAPDDVLGDPDRLRGIFENNWASTVHDVVAFAMRDTPTGRPRGAAIFDATIPKAYAPAAQEAFLRGLLHQSKRQPPKEKTESPAAGRDPLVALFLRGWKSELKDLRQVIRSEWDESAITYNAATQPKTAPAETSSDEANP
jgi:hypothetical protein